MANEQNLFYPPISSREQASEMGKKGGKASGEARRRKRLLREVLAEQLNESGGNGMTKQEVLVARVLNNAQKNSKLDFNDLKQMAELLGESKQTVRFEGGFGITVASQEDADKITEVLDGFRK